MIYNGTMKGKYVILRSVLPKDTETTLNMRLDPEKTKYLHPVENSLDKQKRWIMEQNNRKGDYFFIAHNYSEHPIGTFSIYYIKGCEGHSGRLISFGNALQSFEMNILIFRFAFEYLNLRKINGDVTNENGQAIKLDVLFGFTFEEAVKDTDFDRMVRYCQLKKESFYNNLDKLYKMVYRGRSIPIMPWEQ